MGTSRLRDYGLDDSWSVSNTFLPRLKRAYTASANNPAFAYEAVAICLLHKLQLPEWAASIVIKGLENLLTGALGGKEADLKDPLYLLGLKKKNNRSWLREYRTRMLMLYDRRAREYDSEKQAKALRRRLGLSVKLPKPIRRART